MLCCSKSSKLVLRKVKITFSLFWFLIALLCVFIGKIYGGYVGLAVFIGLYLLSKLKIIEISVKTEKSKKR